MGIREIQLTIVRAMATALGGNPDAAVEVVSHVDPQELKDHRGGLLKELPEAERETLFRLGSNVTGGTDVDKIVLAGAIVNLVLVDPRTDGKSLRDIGEWINFRNGNRRAYQDVLISAGLL